MKFFIYYRLNQPNPQLRPLFFGLEWIRASLVLRANNHEDSTRLMNAVQEPVLSLAIFVARLCLSAVFLASGIHKAFRFTSAIEEFRRAGLPAPSLLALITVVLHLLASAGLLTGILLMESALSLAVFTLLATIKVHDFWNRSGKDRLVSSREALVNLAVIGGLVLLAVTGPGQFTL